VVGGDGQQQRLGLQRLELHELAVQDTDADEGDIEPVGGQRLQVRPGRGHDRLHAHVREPLLIGPQGQGGQLEHPGGRVADPQPAVDEQAGLLGGAGGGVGGLDSLAGLGQQGPAGLGQLDAPAADEQLHAQLPLQGLDLGAERWLGDAQPLGGSAEVQLLGDGDEVAKMSKLHVPTFCAGGRAPAPCLSIAGRRWPHHATSGPTGW
jgi:hypothetical protein